MNTYKRHRFPPDIISYAVWLYYRFNLGHRDGTVLAPTCVLSRFLLTAESFVARIVIQLAYRAMAAIPRAEYLCTRRGRRINDKRDNQLS